MKSDEHHSRESAGEINSQKKKTNFPTKQEPLEHAAIFERYS
jgi:hypothetical protein